MGSPPPGFTRISILDQGSISELLFSHEMLQFPKNWHFQKEEKTKTPLASTFPGSHVTDRRFGSSPAAQTCLCKPGKEMLVCSPHLGGSRLLQPRLGAGRVWQPWLSPGASRVGCWQ